VNTHRLLDKTTEELESCLRRMHENNQLQYRTEPPEVTVEFLTAVSSPEMVRVLHMIDWQEENQS
jgi:hypothetical protein